MCVPQRGVCAGALHAPLRQPVEQQQQETPGAHGTDTHQHHLPQTGLVAPHLLQGHTLMLTHGGERMRRMYTALGLVKKLDCHPLKISLVVFCIILINNGFVNRHL